MRYIIFLENFNREEYNRIKTKNCKLLISNKNKAVIDFKYFDNREFKEFYLKLLSCDFIKIDKIILGERVDLSFIYLNLQNDSEIDEINGYQGA